MLVALKLTCAETTNSNAILSDNDEAYFCYLFEQKQVFSIVLFVVGSLEVSRRLIGSGSKVFKSTF